MARTPPVLPEKFQFYRAMGSQHFLRSSTFFLLNFAPLTPSAFCSMYCTVPGTYLCIHDVFCGWHFVLCTFSTRGCVHDERFPVDRRPKGGRQWKHSGRSLLRADNAGVSGYEHRCRGYLRSSPQTGAGVSVYCSPPAGSMMRHQ